MIPWLDDSPLGELAFPPTELALGPDSPAPGLLCAGGRLSPTRLEAAYCRGIFPWFSPGQPPLWWSPDPRMVLRVEDFRLSHSLRKTIRRFLADPRCELRFDHDFGAVITACAGMPRAGQQGTWIVPSLRRAYLDWHRQGRVHSVETWIDGELAGGLYCVGLGRMVFGESMFARRSDASKIALAALVAFCRATGRPLIDCQQNTRHLASLGAREWTRAAFESHLRKLVGPAPDKAPARGAAEAWAYDPTHWASLGLAAPDAASRPPAAPPSLP